MLCLSEIQYPNALRASIFRQVCGALLGTNGYNKFRDRSEIIGGGGEGSDICPHEKPTKFDPPQTFGKKIVTLPKTIQKNVTLP